MAEVAIVDVARHPDRDQILGQIYQQILVPSFRPDELESIETIASPLSAAQPTRDAAAAVDRSGTALGAAIGDWDPTSRVYLLTYLAVRPGVRSQGVGTQLMQHMLTLRRERGALLMLAEVDDPRRYPVSDTGDPTARLAFYERFGARVLELPYFQPRLFPTSQRVHGMLLLVFDVDPAVLAGRAEPVMRGDALVTFLRGYFAATEGTDDDDPERAQLFERASSPHGVRLLPVARYAEVDLDGDGMAPDGPG
jgi:GNAT superfamily N-acetyltransferase